MELTEEENGGLLASCDGGDKLLTELSTISNNIRDIKNDIHSAISDLKGELKKDFGDELAKRRYELNNKLIEVGIKLQSHLGYGNQRRYNQRRFLSLLKEQHQLHESH
ncbi:uncharacterized protein V6R79_009790 [Siganus canaliculatus]